MMNNNAGGRVVWTGYVDSGGTYNTGVKDIDYVIAEPFSNSIPGSNHTATPTIVCKNCKMWMSNNTTLEVSGSSIIVVNTDPAHSYTTTLKVCAYKYD